METRYLIIGAIIPLFVLGLLGCFVMITGVRRGELRYRGGRWIRGHDGWGFWLVASLCGIGGLGTMLAAVWFGLRALRIGF